jgi:hypothetical protein
VKYYAIQRVAGIEMQEIPVLKHFQFFKEE